MTEFSHYNGRTAPTKRIPSGTEFYRVVSTEVHKRWGANSYNSTNIAELEDPLHPSTPEHEPAQGRCDPVHDESVCPGGKHLGGYIYLGTDPAAAFAEGVFRNKRIPDSGRISRNWLKNKMVARIRLVSDIDVVPLDHTPTLRTLGLNASFWGATWEVYNHTRVSATDMLVTNPHADGIRYPCRHDPDTTAVIIVERDNPPELETLAVSSLETDGWGFRLFGEYLDKFPELFLGAT